MLLRDVRFCCGSQQLTDDEGDPMASVNDTIQNSNVTPLTPRQNSEVRVQLRRDFQNYLNGFAGISHLERTSHDFVFRPEKQLRDESVFKFPLRP